MTRTLLLWLLWLTGTAVAGGALAAVMYVGGSREALLIGETTGAHHQIELACDACHAADPFATPKKTAKQMNKACLACHETELKLSNDSHPVKKFRDPRNADVRAKLDALYCHTCHAEHKPEITRVGAVSLPTDYCSACHQDVGENRPSHRGLGFDTCASSGCHNFHDNTALYEDFLVKHAGGPDVKESPVVPGAAASRGPDPLTVALAANDPTASLAAYLEALDDAPEDPAAEAAALLDRALSRADAAAPSAHLTEEAVAAWAGSAHARAGVNCAGCHAPEADGEAAVAAAWVEAPGLDVCADCHKSQAKSFSEGRHGMRRHRKLPDPRERPDAGVGALVAAIFHDERPGALKVSESPLPGLKPEAGHLEIGGCDACHKPHEVDVVVAGVEACLTCHADDHTRSYAASPHAALWRAELKGEAPAGSGVGCADCHMPKIEDRRDGLVTTHNQNAYLRPNEKMIRSVCMNCHSLDFAIDALADPKLVESNFNGRPSTRIESVEWALKRVK
ncbi:MAG: cytochrome c3 family protein [Pseudomonadota bacterium]